jgi:hypothetical protein
MSAQSWSWQTSNTVGSSSLLDIWSKTLTASWPFSQSNCATS